MKITGKQAIDVNIVSNTSSEKLQQSLINNVLRSHLPEITEKADILNDLNTSTNMYEYKASIVILSPSEYKYLLDIKDDYNDLKEILKEAVK